MSNKAKLRRMAKIAPKLLPQPAPSPSAHLPSEPDEMRQLAADLSAALANELERYRKASAHDWERKDPMSVPDAYEIEDLMDLPLEKVNFYFLQRLYRADPALGLARWNAIVERARQDLDKGTQASHALEPNGGEAWPRACFFAFRQQLHEAWRPRHAGEAHLLDQMAQYEMLRQQWLGVFAVRTNLPASQREQNRTGNAKDESLQLTTAEATRQALAMVERLQRLYQSTLKTLAAMRRGQPCFISQRSGQMNVNVGQQLNMTATPQEPSHFPPLTG